MVKEKIISHADLHKVDLFYQAWKMGEILAGFLEIIERSRDIPNKNALNDIKALSFTLKLLCGPDIGITDALRDKIENDLKELIGMIEKNQIKGYYPLDMINEWKRLIMLELEARSIHLFYLFLLNFNLKDLLRLTKGLESKETIANISKLIDSTIEILENIRKGEKILVSPNLELTYANLSIITCSLRRFKNQVKRVSKSSIDRFKEKVMDAYDIWISLIFDIKNPKDYLPRWCRMLYTIPPLILFIYLISYLIVIILFIIFEKLDMSDPLAKLLSVGVGLISIIIPFLWRLQRKLKEWLGLRVFSIYMSYIK